MRKVLIVAAIAEMGTGLALLIAPSLVGQLLFGEALTGIAVPVARVTGIALIGLGDSLLAGSAARWHVGLQRIGHTVSCLPRFCRWIDWCLSVAGGCAPHSFVNPSRSRLAVRGGPLGHDFEYWGASSLKRIRHRSLREVIAAALVCIAVASFGPWHAFGQGTSTQGSQAQSQPPPPGSIPLVIPRQSLHVVCRRQR